MDLGHQNKIITSEYLLRNIDKYSHLLNVVQHPYEPLISVCYNRETNLASPTSSDWNDVTLSCRGIIINTDTKKIVSYPWNKFFNYDSNIHQNNITENSYILEKLDGSLGILYFGAYDFFPKMASKNSFTSPMAEFGTQWIRNIIKVHGFIFKKYLTYLFEIIYPDNQIIIDYKDREECVLTGIIDTETHQELDYSYLEEYNYKYGISIPKRYSFKNFNEILDNTKKLSWNEEGYVVTVFQDNTSYKYKLKSEEYKIVHKLAFGFSEKNLIQMMEQNLNVIEHLNKLPSFYKNKFSIIYYRLLNTKEFILKRINSKFNKIFKEELDKKTFAELVLNNYKDDSHYLFALYDKNYFKINNYIYKELYDLYKKENENE